MGVFDKIKITASGIGQSMSKGTEQIVSQFTVETKENAKIVAIKADIVAIDAELNACYADIGKLYVKATISGKNIEDIGCQDIIKTIKPKIAKKINLKKELYALEQELADSMLLQERKLVQDEVNKKIENLDRAKSIGALSEEEYSEYVSKEIKKLENFDAIRKLKKQKELGIITEDEMQEKITALLS